MKYKNSKINQTIGINLYNLRKTYSNTTQEKFAEQLNSMLKNNFNIDSKYDYKTISNWEQGKTIPKTEVLIAICKQFDLSLDKLLKNEIDDLVLQSSFSNSEGKLLDDFLSNEDVCVVKDGKLESAFNPESYRYGMLSYLADNLIEYRGELSRNFTFSNPTKTVEVIIGIMDVNDGKRDMHILGNGANDIVSIENVPSGCALNVTDNNIVKSIACSETINNNLRQIIKLGNGKAFYIDWNSPDSNERIGFSENDYPKDLKKFNLTMNDDWRTYTFVNSIPPDDQIFDYEFGYDYYFKKSGIIVATVSGKIKCSDAQLVKILTDDYKHRLVKTLSYISENSICEEYKKQIERYENQKNNMGG